MEFFKEKNGRFQAKPISGPGARSPVLRFVVTLIPLAIIAGLFYFSPVGAKGSTDRTPLIIGGCIVLFSNIITLGIRKAGFGSGIAVDQMTGSVIFRKPGGNRTTVQVTDLKEIVINTVHGKASILCLLKRDNSRYIVMYAKDTMQLRQLANELSTLTSLTVNEEMTQQKYSSQ